MALIRADLCVIGAGAAGLSLAAGAAQLGARVVLIEAGEMGGDCLNAGCVPSKALIAAARAAEAQRRPAVPGIAPQAPAIDFAAVHGHVAAAIAAIAPHDSQERFEGLGVTVLRARARFAGPREVAAGGDLIRARRFAIATGSRPTIPALPGLDTVPFLTNETLFTLREAPAHLLVLGAGPVGLEMAQAHRRLGSAVTVVEAVHALPREDAELAGLVLARLRAEGVTILEGRGVTQVAGAAGSVTLTLADGRRIEGSHLLLAAGRQAATAGLGLDRAGVATDAQGAVITDAGMRTSNRRILALGDVAGQGQFTHLAAAQAGVALRRALLALPARMSALPVPRVTYTEPELAWAGLSEAEARARHGDRLTVIREPFARNDRAVTGAETGGMLKLLVARGRPVGVGIAGPAAGELIAPWALALATGLRLSAIAGAILPYPTLSEVSKRAAGAYFAPKVFENPALRRAVALVGRFLP